MRTIVHGVRTVVLSITLILALNTHSFSQALSTFDGRLEIGAHFGPMFFLGDLGGNAGKGKQFVKDVNLPLANMAKGLFVNFYPDEWIGIRVGFTHGHVEGADSLIQDKGGDEITRMSRNLHFRSQVLEAYTGFEIYPTVFFEQYDGLQGKFRPYGFAGIGVFHFNPQGAYTDNDGSTRWIDLKPLQLEGQGMKEFPDRPNYSLTQINIPLGLGFKYYLKENMYMGLEILHRSTFTDYMDDVSKDYIDPQLYEKYLQPEQIAVAYQMYNRGYGDLTRPNIGEKRGNPNNNDSYFSTVLRFGWRISSQREPLQARCPRY